jgi:hypothetical protein
MTCRPTAVSARAWNLYVSVVLRQTVHSPCVGKIQRKHERNENLVCHDNRATGRGRYHRSARQPVRIYSHQILCPAQSTGPRSSAIAPTIRHSNRWLRAGGRDPTQTCRTPCKIDRKTSALRTLTPVGSAEVCRQLLHTYIYNLQICGPLWM